LKKSILTFLKFAVPLVVIAWLLWTIPDEQLRQLRARPKNAPLLGAALLVVFVAVSLTFVRWYLLVRALRLPFRMLDAFRLGFLGFLFNFVSAGNVGGDLFKAYFIAREQSGRRPEAVATVVVDRIIGLYALLLLTSTAIVVWGPPSPNVEVKVLCRLSLIATAVGGIGVVMLLVPGFTSGTVSEFLTGLPKCGTMLGQLIAAVRIYRRQWLIVVVGTLMSIVTHGLFALSFYFIAGALFEHIPSLREHLFLVPLGMVAGALPFTPAGFGAFEFAMEKLYQVVPAASNIDVSGVLVALVYRLLTIVVASLGMIVYWSSRGEVRRAWEDVEHTGP
jgi:glycosyltransferase 2 family protein